MATGLTDWSFPAPAGRWPLRCRGCCRLQLHTKEGGPGKPSPLPQQGGVVGKEAEWRGEG